MRSSLRSTSTALFTSAVCLMSIGCAGSVNTSFTPSTLASQRNQASPSVTVSTSFAPTAVSPFTQALQGVAFNGSQAAYVSSTTWLASYGPNWTLNWNNKHALATLPSSVDHMGAIVYANGNNLIGPVEHFSSCSSFSSGLLAVFNASSGVVRTWSDIHAEGFEASAVAVIPEKNQVVVASYCNANMGNSKLLVFDLNALLNNAPGSPIPPIATINLSSPIQFIQGISWNSDIGTFVVSADIGIAGSLYYISPEGIVSGPAYVVPSTQAAELEGVDFTTGNIYFLENCFVYSVGAPVAKPAIRIAPQHDKHIGWVSITDSTSGAAIHYTLDGSIPTSSSPVYSESIKIRNGTTVSAIAFLNGRVDSPMTTAAY